VNLTNPNSDKPRCIDEGTSSKEKLLSRKHPLGHPPTPFKVNLVGKLLPLGIKNSNKSYRRKKQRVHF
jgi:hypothetical protein